MKALRWSSVSDTCPALLQQSPSNEIVFIEPKGSRLWPEVSQDKKMEIHRPGQA